VCGIDRNQLMELKEVLFNKEIEKGAQKTTEIQDSSITALAIC
jgi:hypothetical protein